MLSQRQVIFATTTFIVSLVIISSVHARSEEIVRAMPFVPTPTFTITPSPTPTNTPTPTLTPTPTNTPTPTSTPTPTPTNTPHPLPASDFESYFDQYSNQYGVDKNKLKKIAQCESGIHPGANNGEYGGMFQFSIPTWQGTRAQMALDTNPDLRFGARESIETAAFKISRGGENAWANCL